MYSDGIGGGDRRVHTHLYDNIKATSAISTGQAKGTSESSCSSYLCSRRTLLSEVPFPCPPVCLLSRHTPRYLVFSQNSILSFDLIHTIKLPRGSPPRVMMRKLLQPIGTTTRNLQVFRTRRSQQKWAELSNSGAQIITIRRWG